MYRFNRGLEQGLLLRLEPKRRIAGGLFKFLAVGCGLNERQAQGNRPVAKEPMQACSPYPPEAHCLTRSQRRGSGINPLGSTVWCSIEGVRLYRFNRGLEQGLLLRLEPKRRIAGGLFKFLAVGCGLNKIANKKSSAVTPSFLHVLIT